MVEAVRVRCSGWPNASPEMPSQIASTMTGAADSRGRAAESGGENRQVRIESILIGIGSPH
jgi:hypothetical protein